MKNLKKELFEFRQNLDIEKEDISTIIDKHINQFGNCSEKYIVESLNKDLEIHTYDKEVKNLLNEVNSDLEENKIEYDLKDLYKRIEASNQGEVYRHPMKVILEIIHAPDHDTQRYKILNELSLYDFIPEVKNFVYQYTANPLQKANLSSSGGKGEKVYSAIEPVEEGHLTFVKDHWFLLSEKEIEPTTLDRWFKDPAKLKQLGNLENALMYGEFTDDNKLNFQVDENLVIGVGLKDGDLYINEEKTDKETNLDNIFSSSMIDHMKRDFYPIIAEALNNTDKFVELDFVTKVTNITKPYLECYAFNYKDKIYLYNIDMKDATNFYEYENATKIVNEMQNTMGFDLTYFYKNKFDKDVMIKRGLEDREQKVLEKLENINNNIEKLEASQYISQSEQLKEAKNVLEEKRKKLNKRLKTIRSAMSDGDVHYVS